ncbi:hypothetical protein D1AOALGA4SA_6032 [Olavius algarvensis Delta 1 endosymbiont]|nr:hypothetical protein D1AOALGA4SA_6032 [Olavius algarvensis Delta 1 endosymbiont]
MQTRPLYFFVVAFLGVAKHLEVLESRHQKTVSELYTAFGFS